MFFKRRSKRSIPSPYRKQASSAPQTGDLYLIEYDMMLKGSVIKRGGTPVRQFGVYVDGSIRLVTSGDRVDRETYEALLAEGAIAQAGGHAGDADAPAREKAPRIIEDFGPDTE